VFSIIKDYYLNLIIVTIIAIITNKIPQGEKS